MRKLPKPAYSAADAYAVCISRVASATLKARLNAAKSNIATASDDYEQAVLNGSVHTLPIAPIVNPDVTIKEMKDIYNQRMVKSKSPGRAIYDAIYISAPGGKCPLCSQRPVSTLDHNLPKAHYPALAVAPLNLVPACSDCNKAKSDKVPSCSEEVALHPYFDDLGNDVWLTARVVEKKPAALKFRLKVPAGWTPTLAARVRNHFRDLDLGALYASEAADELLNIRHQLITLRQSDPLKGVRDELERRALSCESGSPNGWRAAAYRAWCENQWFCSGGFEGK